MIPDVDDTLRRMLAAELAKLPGCPVYDAEQITFDSPNEAAAAQDGEARVNLFLHDLRENVDLREQTFHRERAERDEHTVGIRRAPLRINLAYLVTAHAGHDPATEHRLMADVMGVLMTHLAIPRPYLCGTLEGLGSDVVLLSVGQPDDLEKFNPSSLWQAVEAPIQPSLILVVTAPMNPFETKWTKRVREMVYGTGRGSEQTRMVRPDNIASVQLSVAGIVLDQQTETPLAGVRVWVEGLAETTTDQNGLFSFANLPAGPQTVQFRRRGYRVNELAVRVPPAGRTDQAAPVVMALRAMTEREREAETASLIGDSRSAPGVVQDGPEARPSLTGTLRLPGGSPAAFVLVRAAGRETITDADGVYAFFGLPSGDHAVTAVLPGQDEATVSAEPEAKRRR